MAGPIEQAYRDWISEMGEISPRYLAIAEQIYRLAALIDMEGSGSGSATSATSRELRQLGKEFRQTPASKSGIGLDEIARKRAERRGQVVSQAVKPPFQELRCSHACDFEVSGRHSRRCPVRTEGA